MTGRNDIERLMRAFLAEGTDRVADRVIDAALDQIDHAKQRRAWRVPWRFPEMNNRTRVAATALVVVVAAAAAYAAFGPKRTDVGGSPPTPTPNPTSTPLVTVTETPSPTPIDTATWTTYTSSQYGFSIGHPAGWTEVPATRDWTFETDATDWLSPGADAFFTPVGGGVRVSAWSLALDPGMTTDPSWIDVEAWVKDYCQKTGNGACAAILDGAVRLCVEVRDCHPGLLVPFESEVQAFFTGGNFTGQMVIVTVWWGESEPAVAQYGGSRRLLEAFLSTMDVWDADHRPPPS
jgi:hypothetical protein